MKKISFRLTSDKQERRNLEVLGTRVCGDRFDWMPTERVEICSLRLVKAKCSSFSSFCVEKNGFALLSGFIEHFPRETVVFASPIVINHDCEFLIRLSASTVAEGAIEGSQFVEVELGYAGL